MPTTRAFTLPRLTSPARIAVPGPLEAGRELENSAELDLPQLGDISMLLTRPPTKSEDIDVDVSDTKSDAEEPSPADEPEESRTTPRLPPPQTLRPAAPVPAPAEPEEPGALAYLGLAGLCAALAACWGLYYAGHQDMSLVTGSSFTAKVLTEPAARERDEQLTALFDGDALEGYLTAQHLAEQSDDPLGAAEAALRIHVRYGPDPVRVAQAAAWLSATASHEPVRAVRVRGLAALADGNIALAQELLAQADGPGTTLYRGLSALAAGDFAAAREAASSALSERPSDQAAVWLSFAAELASDRRASLDPLREAADRPPHRAALRLLLADALIERGRLVEARKRLEEFERTPGMSDAHYARVLVRRARVAAAAVEFNRAVPRADEALRLAPNDVEVVHAALRVLIEADELGRAQQGLAARLREHPDDREALLLQAELALRSGNESATTRAIERLAAEPSTMVEASYYRGRLALLTGSAEEAARQFLAAATAEPPHVRAAVEFARLRPRDDEALPLLERLLELRQRDPTERARADLRALALARANLLVEIGRREAAVAALDAALALDPDDNAAQLRRGVLALETGRVDAGRVDLLAVHERTGGFPGLIGPLSRLYIRSGEIRALETLLQPHLSDQRAPEEVILAIARLRLAQNAVEAAESLTEQILLRNPSSWEGHLLKANVLLARGETAAAQAELRLCRPGHASADVELTAGKIAESTGRLQEALSLYRRAHQLAPTLHEARYLHGRALLQLGRAQEAIAELTAMTRATDAFPAAFVALGQALHERGNFEEARRQLQRAVTLDPALAEGHYWLGRSEHDLALYAEAAVSLTRAVRGATPATPWLADAHLWLARTAEAQGDSAASRTAYQEFLRLAPAAAAAARREAERALERLGRLP
ncbi:MAG TPA: tetratricopeptide repeat protein [Nannocystis sp.]